MRWNKYAVSLAAAELSLYGDPDQKAHNSENGVVWVAEGNSVSLEIAPFDRAHISSY